MPTAPPTPSLRLVGIARLYLLSGTMALVALGVTLIWLRYEGVLPGAPLQIGLWVLTAGFVAGESLAVTLETREEAHQLNFVEVIYALALLLADPVDMVLARVLGGVVVLGILKRQSRHKLLANVSIFALEAATCAAVYQAAVGSADPMAPIGWLAVFVAIGAAYAVSSVGATLAIATLTGWPGRQVLLHVFGIGGLLALANAAVGLGVAASVWERSGIGVLFVGVVAVLFGLNRAFTRLKERHRDLATLHDFTRRLGDSLEIAGLEEAVLGGMREILRGEHAALLLPPAREGLSATRVVALADRVQRVEISPAELERDLTLLVSGGEGRLLSSGDPIPGWMAEIGVKDVLTVPLVSDAGGQGVALVMNRLTEFNQFVVEDLQVFGTLARHAGVALENGRLVATLQHDAQEKAYQALHDPVTGLPNRRMLQERLGAAISEARGTDLGVALLFIDLVTFKEVNDTLGIATGDRLLMEVRQRIEALLPHTAQLARFTGDQFAVLVSRVADAQSVIALAEQVVAGFDTPFTADEVSLVLGADIGVALYPDHATNAELLLQRADAATYRARQEGSGIELYAAETDPYAPRRLALAADLREALERDEVDVYVQPKMSLLDGAVVGAEALVRWTHPVMGPLSPDQFIPAAEHTGVIRQLTAYVVRHGLAQCKSWRDAGLDLAISVNLSGRNLFDSHLVEDIGDAIEEAGVPPSALTLELTESTVMAESNRSMAVLDGLRDLGVRLSIDDFGTGYSSLTHLRQLPVTELKIDKSFVMTMMVNDQDAVIVRTLVDLGRSLGLRTVAEGVESQEAREMLRDFGCQEAQGYLFSRPIPADQFEVWLTRQEVRRIDHGHTVIPFHREPRRAVNDDQG